MSIPNSQIVVPKFLFFLKVPRSLEKWGLEAWMGTDWRSLKHHSSWPHVAMSQMTSLCRRTWRQHHAAGTDYTQADLNNKDASCHGWNSFRNVLYHELKIPLKTNSLTGDSWSMLGNQMIYSENCQIKDKTSLYKIYLRINSRAFCSPTSEGGRNERIKMPSFCNSDELWIQTMMVKAAGSSVSSSWWKHTQHLGRSPARKINS